jgi:hypothetical protein
MRHIEQEHIGGRPALVDGGGVGRGGGAHAHGAQVVAGHTVP